MTKWIIAVGVLVIIGVGLWWSGVLSSFMPKAAPAVQQQATTTPQQQTQQPVSDLPTAGSDNSDAALVQDSAAVDAQIKSLNSDSSNIDSGMNDKPINQEF
jgi:cytoskeletal protein RodZ